MIATQTRKLARKDAKREWTFAEMRTEFPESNLPTELWDGATIMSPAPSFFHQQVVDRFHDRLKAWVRPRRLGRTCAAPVDMVLARRRAVQPDVVFIASARANIVADTINGAADLVAEVISPESRRRDRFDKKDLYEQHGVKEYWLIDPDGETVEVFHLKRGEYQLAGRWRVGEVAVSSLLEGFTVPVNELFSEG